MLNPSFQSELFKDATKKAEQMILIDIITWL